MPPIPAGQVGEAVDLLMKAVEKDHHEKQYNQFATQLIAMTLNFLTRMIKSQVRILDEQQETSGVYVYVWEGKGVTHTHICVCFCVTVVDTVLLSVLLSYFTIYCCYF